MADISAGSRRLLPLSRT